MTTERRAGSVAGDPGARSGATRKSLDDARNFLSTLFMALRTAQIHDSSNKAFENAVQSLHASAETLYAVTGGFTIQFVDESAFLNGTRLRFEGGTFATMRTLRSILESRGLGGVELKTPPSRDAIRKLILLFAKEDGSAEISPEDLKALHIGVLGVQRFADQSRNMNVDRRVFAVQCYAKLLLALREQFQRVQKSRASGRVELGQAPRLRAVRVIQDLIELCSDRADFLLRLSTNRTGAPTAELHGVNVCLLTITMGHCLGLSRQDLVDLGVAALFHHVGLVRDDGSEGLGPELAQASLARLLAETGVGRSSYTRAIVIAEQCDYAAVPSELTRRLPHFLSRLLSTAIAFNQLLGGFGTTDGSAFAAVDALALLNHDNTGCFDPRMVDLLINVLRAYPEGAEVVLDDGTEGVVTGHADGARWDRPIVRLPDGFQLDLMKQTGGRFTHRVVGTKLYLGRTPLTDDTLVQHLEARAQAAARTASTPRAQPASKRPQPPAPPPAAPAPAEPPPPPLDASELMLATSTAELDPLPEPAPTPTPKASPAPYSDASALELELEHEAEPEPEPEPERPLDLEMEDDLELEPRAPSRTAPIEAPAEPTAPHRLASRSDTVVEAPERLSSATMAMLTEDDEFDLDGPPTLPGAGLAEALINSGALDTVIEDHRIEPEATIPGIRLPSDRFEWAQHTAEAPDKTAPMELLREDSKPRVLESDRDDDGDDEEPPASPRLAAPRRPVGARRSVPETNPAGTPSLTGGRPRPRPKAAESPATNEPSKERRPLPAGRGRRRPAPSSDSQRPQARDDEEPRSDSSPGRRRLPGRGRRANDAPGTEQDPED